LSLYPTSHPASGKQLLFQKALNLLSDDVKTILQSAKSNLNALNTKSNKTGLSIEKFLESPFAGIHPKLLNKGTKAAAAEVAVAAAKAIAVEDLEDTKRLAADFEASGGGALTMALAQEAELGDHLRER
jgi:hypothetical protein